MKNIILLLSVFLAYPTYAQTEEDSLLGLWDFQINTPDGIELVIVEITGQPGNYQGTFDGPKGKAQITNIEIDGAKFSFDHDVEKFFVNVTVTFNGIVEGEQLEGHLKTPMGLKEFNGVRKQ